ncbi:aminoglycoside adenylyltransferase domain-containing protein [Catelliglobosispora koreensis]|uniref:aminoglycoside adenylyltransferase domain-containing protein n=1 Tax=Catelliglobosispora koreensis TaxID=129052 RepID=UPI0003776BD9|nr:aminoglycoside adenylyltransferase domain-containing protein [Catelliglobosispora koreensis]
MSEGVLHLVQGVLGDDLLGAYQHGSATLGGMQPHSDIDVLAVTRRALTDPQRRALTAELLRNRFDRPVELILAVESDVKPWRYPPVCDFLYGEWLRASFERGELPARHPAPDLAVLITMVLQGNAILFGPPPHELLDPVPSEDLRNAMVAGLPSLLADLDDDTRNVLLTFARIWATLATGQILRKDKAADWALAELPPGHRPVLEHARAIYLGEADEHWSEELFSRVHQHAGYVVAQIEGLVS